MYQLKHIISKKILQWTSVVTGEEIRQGQTWAWMEMWSMAGRWGTPGQFKFVITQILIKLGCNLEFCISNRFPGAVDAIGLWTIPEGRDQVLLCLYYTLHGLRLKEWVNIKLLQSTLKTRATELLLFLSFSCPSERPSGRHASTADLECSPGSPPLCLGRAALHPCRSALNPCRPEVSALQTELCRAREVQFQGQCKFISSHLHQLG